MKKISMKNKIYLAIGSFLFVLSLMLFVNKVNAATLDLIDTGGIVGTATIGLDKAAYSTKDKVLLNLQFPINPSGGSYFNIAGYRITNNANYVISGNKTAGTFDPIPSNLVVKSNITRVSMTNQEVASNLPAGTYTLFVYVRKTSDIVPGYINNTVVPRDKTIISQPMLYDGLGTRYAWAQTALFFPVCPANCTGDGFLGVYTTTFTVSQDFNFSISNGGNKKINVGDVVTNTITTTLTPTSVGSGNVVLTLDSIKDSSDNELLGLSTTTFKLRQNTFAKGVVVPTETTTLSFDSLPSTPNGQYIVTVSGKYTATTSDTVNPKSYICTIKWDPINKGNNQYNGWYFGCSQDPTFNPMIDYYNISKDSTYPFSIQCIDLDDGQCKNSSNPNGYVVSSIGANMLINFRRTLAARECGAGNYTISLPEANATSGFSCNSVVSGNSSIVKTLVKSTTFILDVYNYDLKVTSSNCTTNPGVQYMQPSWKAGSSGIPAALIDPSYNIYRTRLSTNTVTKIHVALADLTLLNDRWYYKDTTYGADGELFKYTVTYNPTNTVSEWGMSNVSYAYSPAACPNPNGGITPNIKLFTKKTTDNAINLNTYNGSTTLTVANTSVTLAQGETFDLRWITNLTSDYTCSQITQIPGNTINNIIWGYGYSRNGASTGLNTAGLATGQYTLRLSCISGTGSTSLSNTITVNITSAPSINYNLNVSQSGNQCSTADIWIKQTWNAIPGATSYKVTRTKTSPAETITFTTASTQNIETYPTFTTGATYSYTVAAIIGGVEQTPSATTTIVSPAISCPPIGSAAIKLFIKRSTDSSVNLPALTFASFVTTANSEASVLKGDKFDIRWISNLTPDYNSCGQSTVKPNGQTDNTIWLYGSGQNGYVPNIDTSNVSLVGTYNLSVWCTNGISIISNTAKLYVIDYSLNVSTSGDKCLSEQANLAITETWSIVPGATAYKITRTSPSLPTVIYSPLVANQKIEASSTSATFNYNTQYTYTVAATVNGVEQIASLPVTATSPSIVNTNCPQPTLLLEIKKGTDSDSSYSGSASITVGDTFYLRWTSAFTNQAYTCTATTTKPDGTSGNGIWTWGNSLNGTSAALSSTGQAYGQYNFKMNCTGNSDGSALPSNTVTLDMAPAPIVVNPSTTTCPGVCGPVWPPNNPAPPPVLINPQVRLFLGSQSAIQAKTISDTPSSDVYTVKKGNSAKIKFITSLPASYNCSTQVLKSDGSPVDLGKLQWSANRTVNNNVVQNITTSNVEPGLYTFTLICPDANSSDVQSSNDQKLQISDSTIKEK